MNNLLFFIPFFVIVAFAKPCLAQQVDSVRAKAEYGFKSEAKILAKLDQIDFYKVSFVNKTLKGNPYLVFTTKEYSKGEVIKLDTLIPPSYARELWKFKIIDSNSVITITTKPHGDSVRFLYDIMGSSFTKYYKRHDDDAYSLRDGLVTNEEFKSIPVGKTLPLFAYSLPYVDPKQPGYRFYCAITANGLPPEKWWDTFKIPHFIIVEMKIATE